MKRSFLLASLLVLSFPLFGAGCIQIKSGGVDGGVFFSQDKGERWERRIFVEQIKKKTVTIASVNVTDLMLHPRDEKILYAATREDGLYKTVNAGEQWAKLPLQERSLLSLAIDRKSPDIVYAVSPKQLFQSPDGGKTWTVLYTERRERVTISAFLLHALRTEELYLGFSSGDLLKSRNQGVSWMLQKTFPAMVTSIAHPAFASDLLYVGTQNSFWKTTNNGKDWFDLSPYLDKYSNARVVGTIVVDPNHAQTLFLIAKHGILRSADEGVSWQSIPLLVPSGDVRILSFALNTKKSDREWYYGTTTTLYKTIDSGKSWIAKPLPTSRAATALALSSDATVLYLGVASLK